MWLGNTEQWKNECCYAAGIEMCRKHDAIYISVTKSHKSFTTHPKIQQGEAGERTSSTQQAGKMALSAELTR